MPRKIGTPQGSNPNLEHYPRNTQTSRKIKNETDQTLGLLLYVCSAVWLFPYLHVGYRACKCYTMTAGVHSVRLELEYMQQLLKL